MSSTYSFEFQGTRDMFLKILNQYSNNDNKFFYLNDYIVEISGDNYYFGVARGGHSGGYWFKPTITETDGKLIFCGKIEYINSYSSNKGFNKTVNKLEEGFLMVFLFPLILLIRIVRLFRLIIRKIKKQPVIKEETEEDRLFYLMEDLLNCTRK